MFKLKRKHLKLIDQYLKQENSDDLANLLRLIASWLEPFTVGYSDMDWDTQVYLQEILQFLAEDPEFFTQATMLLGLIYFDDDKDDSPEVKFKNLFFSGSTIPAVMKKDVLEALITKNQENTEGLAFYIIETILPKEDEEQRAYFLTLVLNAMRNSKCKNTPLQARRLLTLIFEKNLYTPNKMSEILKDIVVQLARSDEFMVFFSDMENKFSVGEFLLERHSESGALQWTSVAPRIFQDALPMLSARDVHVFLNRVSDNLLAQNSSMQEQQHLLEPLLTMNVSESVTAWANFILENLSPPVSPVKSYRSTSPIAPFWDRTKWEIKTTKTYRTVGLTDVLVFKEIRSSQNTFCLYEVLGISQDAIMQKIQKTSPLMKKKFDDYKNVKREIDNLNTKYADVNSQLWHPKDLKKYENYFKLALSLYDECMVFHNEIKTYQLFLSTFAESVAVNDIKVLAQYAKLENIKICLWQQKDYNDLILFAQSHDDYLDPDTLHFVITQTYLNQLHRSDIKHHINVVLKRMSMSK